MQSWQFGPLFIPHSLLPWLAGFLAAWLLAWYYRRRAARHAEASTATDAESALFMAVLAGVVGARLGFVLRHQDTFAGQWLAATDLRDGGLWWPAGLLAGLLVLAAVPGLRRARVRRERASLVGIALLAALPVAGGLHLQAEAPPPLPALTLHTLSGQPVALADLADGQPLVINLWATWCPHCHRSMPALDALVAERPDVTLLMINQGESAGPVREYLTTHERRFPHVLLDPSRALGTALGSHGVPLTLVVAPDGHIVAAHTGGVSLARLHDLLASLPGR